MLFNFFRRFVDSLRDALTGHTSTVADGHSSGHGKTWAWYRECSAFFSLTAGDCEQPDSGEKTSCPQSIPINSSASVVDG